MKNCLTFETASLLIFIEKRTDPQTAPPCVYKLCSFWRSVFERHPVSSFLAFGIFIRNQSWRYTSIPAASCKVKQKPGTFAFWRWSCWAESVSKFPFSTTSSHPLLKFANWRAWYEDKTNFCRLKSLFWQTVYYIIHF